MLSVSFKAPELIKNINLDTRDSDPSVAVEIDGTLYFSATDGETGYELWRSDGTYDGTQQVADIQQGEMGSSPRYLVNVGGTLYFTADDGETGRELWRHNPATGVTERFADLVTGVSANGSPYSSSPMYLTYIGGSLFCSANHPDYGRELWRIDLASGTTEMMDLFAGTDVIGRPNSSSPRNLTEFNGMLVFAAVNGDGQELRKSWKDVTTGQWLVDQVKDINPGGSSSYLSELTVFNNKLYFDADDGDADGSTLWESDGTEANTREVLDASSKPVRVREPNLTVVDTTLFFKAYDATTAYELWKLEGSDAPQMVKDIYSGQGNAYPENLTAVNGVLFFSASDGPHARELWKSDGTEAGTRMVRDIRTGEPVWQGSDPQYLTNVNGTLFFSADDGIHGRELWKCYWDQAANFGNGAWEATLLMDIATGNDGPNGAPSSSNPYDMVALDGQLLFLFSADDEYHGRELWKSDGTAAGTSLVRDIELDTESSSPLSFTQVGDTTFFVADDRVHGRELWKTDGTADGTQLVRDIAPGGDDGGPMDLTEVNGTLFFSADDGSRYGTYGRELWKSDGTAAGTVLVADLNPGSSSSGPYRSFPQHLTNFNGTLFFSAGDNTRRNLWKSSGTAATTTMVLDGSGNAFSSVDSIAVVGDTLYFRGDNGTGGVELWKIQGTASPVMVKDIKSGSGDSSPQNLSNADGTLFFTADDGVHGRELWVSDGTSDGTRMVRDINTSPGASGYIGSELTFINGTLYFSANDGVNGRELWKSYWDAMANAGSGAWVAEMVKDIRPGANTYGYPYESYPSELTNVGGTLFFRTAAATEDPFSGSSYQELWQSDGTEAGTQLVQAFPPDPSYVYGDTVGELVDVDGKLFFSASDDAGGMELWTSDGTTTEQVMDINPGAAGSSPGSLTNAGGNLLFSAGDKLNGNELWWAERDRPPVSVDDFYKVDQNETLHATRTSPGGGTTLTSFPGEMSYPIALAVDAQGRIVAAGEVDYDRTSLDLSDVALARYAVQSPFTGALDSTFGGDGLVTYDISHTTSVGEGAWDGIEDIAIQDDGKIVGVGWCRPSDETSDAFLIVRFTEAGLLDPDFGADGGIITHDFGPSYDYGTSVAIQDDGKIIAAGSATLTNEDIALVRYNSDGSLDDSFGMNGAVTLDLGGAYDRLYDVGIQSDGKIVAIGDTWMVRFNADGTLDDGSVSDSTADGAFGTDGIVPLPGTFVDLAIGSDDSLVVTGTVFGTPYRAVVARYNADGSPDDGSEDDTTPGDVFGSGGLTVVDDHYARSVAIQSDGKIVVGTRTNFGADMDFALFRLQTDGTLDTDFGDGGYVVTDLSADSDTRDMLEDVAIAPDGKIVASGHIYWNMFAVARYNKDGSLDAVPAALTLNDYDPNGDAFTAELVSAPLHGVVRSETGVGKINPDGTFEYTPDSEYVGYDTFTYKVVDTAGLQSAVATVTIAVGQVKAEPGGPYVIDEGDPLALDGSRSFDLDGDALSFSWDLDDDGAFDDATGQRPTLTWSELVGLGITDGTWTVGLRAEDGDGHVDDAFTTLTVNNVAPSFDLGDSLLLAEGESLVRAGSFFDPGADTWTATVDYGDGSGQQPLSLDGKFFTLSHAYGDDGDYTVIVTVSDGLDTASSHFLARVYDVAPRVEAGPDETIEVGQPLSVAALFTDPAAPDFEDFTANIDWGDGNMHVGVVTETTSGTTGPTSGVVTGKHAYTVPGQYQVEVRVVDDEFRGGVDTFTVTVNEALPLWGDTITTIEGIDFNADAYNSDYYHVPPDPIAAAGPEHVVSIVNTSIQWATKSGVLENSQRLGADSTGSAAGSFFEPLNPVTGTFDPKVIYDQYAGRFVAVALERDDAAGTSRILLAVSDDSDPNGTWHYQAVDGMVSIGGVDHWADYPGFAVSSEAIYITGNMFTFGATRTFGGSRLWIIDKGLGAGGLYDGGPAGSVTVHDPSTAAGLPGQAFTIQPAHMYGTAPAGVGTFLINSGWVLGDGVTDVLSVIRLDDPLGTPTFTNTWVSVGDVTTTSDLPNASQPGTAVEIEANDGCILNAVWRDDALWATNTVLPPSGPDAGELTAHWYQIDTSVLNGDEVFLPPANQGDVGGDDIDPEAETFFPSIAVDKDGNMGIGFALSSPNDFAAACFASRLASDPAGTVGPTRTLAEGEGPYLRTFGGTRNRWGDYSGMALDPADELTFWVFNEYALTPGAAFGGEDGRWGTRFGSFSPSVPVVTIPRGGGTTNVIEDSGDLVVHQGNLADPLLRAPLSSVSGLAIRGSTDTDFIYVNLANLLWDVLPSGIWLTGGESTDGSDNDTLVVANSQGAQFLGYRATGSESGVIDVDDLPIYFDEFEPIECEISPGTMEFALGAPGDQTIRVSDGTTTEVSRTTISSDGTGGFESITFVTPKDAGQTVLIKANDGNNRVILDRLAEDFQAAITVEGGKGDDIIDASGCNKPVTLDGGDGADTMTGGSGDDVILGGDGDDAIDGGAGVDNVDAGGGNNTLVIEIGENATLNEGDSFGIALPDYSESDTLDWGDETVVSATEPLTHVYGDNDVYTVSWSGDATATSTVTVQNVVPTVAAELVPIAAVPGQEVSISGSFTDPGTGDTHTLVVQWGDGNTETANDVPVGDFLLTHVYDAAGVFPVTLSLYDDDMSPADAVSFHWDLTVAAVAVQLDPQTGDRVVAVGATTGDDTIRFGRGGNSDEVVVTVNGVDQGVFRLADFDRLVAFGREGDDTIEVAGSIEVPAWLYGGPGNDRLKGGAGHDVLLGEAGDDVLVGNSGRDILIGGTGSDRIIGNADDDILIAGWLVFADPNLAVRKIRDEWLSTVDPDPEQDYLRRIRNLTTGDGSDQRLNDIYFLTVGETINDDEADVDVLTGSAGLDWFFFDFTNRDRATDLKDEAFVDVYDWINEDVL